MVIDETVEPEAPTGQRHLGGARVLARNAVGSFALNLVNVATTLGTMVLLARIMGASEFGTYSFVVATATLLGIPSILGVDRLLTRDIAVHTSRAAFGLARGLFRRAQQLVLAISLAIGLTAAAAAWIAAGGEVSASLVAFWLAAAALPFLAVGRIVQGGLMGLHHILLGQSAEYVLRPTVLLALTVGYAIAGATLAAPTAVLFQGLSLGVACAVSVAWLRARTPKDVRDAAPVYETRRWVLTAVSLGLLSGAAVLNSQIGVALLGAISGAESAGLYAVAQRGALLIAFPLSAVTTAIGPTAARLWASGERDRLQRLVTLSARAVLLTAMPLVVGYVVLGRALLTALFGPDFADADVALAILALGQLVNVATGTVATLLIMTGYQRKAALGISVGALVNVAGAVTLIPALGTAGAALAAAGGIALSNIMLVIAAHRHLGIHSTALGRIGLR